MAKKPTKFDKSILLKGTTTATTEEGEIRNDSASTKVKVFIEASEREVVTADQAQTLENKSIDSADNTIVIDADEATVSELELDNLKAGVLDTDLSSVSASDDTIASAKAIKAYVDGVAAGQDEASEISYDNSTSGLTAVDVQGAIDEVEDRVDNSDAHIAASSGVHGVSGDVVGTTDAQSLTNKSIEGPSRLDVKKDTKSNLETYAGSASDGQFVFATDSKEMFQVVDSALAAVGSGATVFEITQASHGLALGDGIYFNGTIWVKAQADAAGTLATFCVSEVSGSGVFKAASFARLEAPSHGFTLNTYYFLSSAVAGLPTSTEPTSGFSNPLFYVEDANILQVLVYRPSAVSNTVELDQLSDVSVPAPTDGQALVWVNANSRWEAIDVGTQVELDAHIADTTTHGTTGDIVGTSDAQVITAKDIDGGTASNTSRLTIPKAAKATLDALTRKEATFVFDTDTKSGYLDNGTDLLPLGAGAGSLDIFFQETFEINDSTSFTTGNDAAPDAAGTGTLDGAVADETTNPISDVRSIKYTMGSSSANDFFIIDTDITIDIKQAGNPIAINFYYKYNGDDGDIKVLILDQDDVVLSDSLDLLDAASNSTRFSTSVNLPIGTTGLRYGFQVVTGNSAKVLTFDDIELTLNPFVAVDLDNITPWEAYTPTITGFGTPTGIDIKFRQVGDSIEIQGEFTPGTSTAVEAQVSLPNSLTVNGYTNAVDAGSYIRSLSNNSNGGVLLITDGDAFFNFSDNSVYGATASNASTPANASNVAASGQTVSFTILVPANELTAQTEHIVTPAKSNLTGWVANTPTASAGHGTIDRHEEFYRVVGDTLEVQGYFRTGTVTSADNFINLPTGFTIDFTKIITTDDRQVHGEALRYTSTSAIWNSNEVQFALFSDGSNAGRMYVARRPNNVSQLEIAGVNATTASSQGIAYNYSVPVNEVTADVQFLAAVPVQRVAYIKDLKAVTTAGGSSSSNTVHTRDLNTVEGDTGLVSLSTNKFTLQKGLYSIEAMCPCSKADITQAFVYNVTTTTYIIDGISASATSSLVFNYNVFVSGSIEITTAQEFEIRHYIETGKTTNGLGGRANTGSSNNPGANEVYTVVKITKLK